MFIELDRSFRTLVDDPAPTVSDDAKLVPSTTSLKWGDLLNLHRVVVLSEAGAGKTEEIRHATRSLRADGKAAFFLRLEHISTSFEAAFEEGTNDEFGTWLESPQEGWLLLDSIDESRLRDPMDFEAAVRILGLRLRPALQRVRLILTGRTAAWRPSADLALCLRHPPYSAPIMSAVVDDSVEKSAVVRTTPVRPADPGHAPFTIVSLEDLSVAQARLFATAAGIRNVHELLDAIERADGWSFTTRPLDLEELLEFWQSNGRIGSRLELLRASIDRRLREQDQNRDEQNPLTLDKARAGARLVAAACTLTLQQTIAVPDRSKSARGLQLDVLLGGWSAKEHATLLQRPIFDEEIYGTVRFHHRSAREYLTAEWFAELLKQNTSRKAVETLFFREQYGLVVVPPVLRPVLPWLAVLDQRIQERALLVAPEVLLSDGDPSRLLLTTRQRVLDATCAALSAGSPRQPGDYSAIQRFAADDLVPDMRRLLAAHKDEESQVFLLRMVWQGRLSAGEERSRFAMTVLTQVVGGRRGGTSRVRRAFCTAVHLKTLYLLAHEHIRIEDDLNRAGGGVYSPGLRDDAQDAREHLLALLRELPGKEAFVALSEVACAHPSQRHRKYIELLAKAKAETDATGAAWSESQVREFNDEHERLPRNHRELFDLATLRLLDLKEDLEHGDSSDAPMLARVESEGHVRTYIGNSLRNMARGRYGVPQEEELADAKRPDLRFHGIPFDAPVPVELKLADNWSGPQLFERLETQLCGDYLRDRRSTCGVFLLVYRGKQKSWHLPDAAGVVDFSGLVLSLHERWVALSPSLPNVDDILVIGIDLTKRAAAA